MARARALVRRDAGNIQLIRIISRDHPPPLADYTSDATTGSFFDDFTTHDLDMARWLLGEDLEVLHVGALSCLDAKGPHDTAGIMLQGVRSGAIVTIENSRRTTYGYDQVCCCAFSVHHSVLSNLFPFSVTSISF